MLRRIPAWTGPTLAVILPAWLAAFPATALAQRQQSGDAQESAASAGSGSSSERSAPVAAPRAESSAEQASPRRGSSGTPATDRAVERRRGGNTRDEGTDSRPGTGGDQTAPNTRPREGRPPVGEAVARRPSRPSGRGGSVIVPGGYYGGYYGGYPWGYGGFGLGSYYGGYYGGYYDPWYGGPYGNYPQYGYSRYDGSLRLKVKPREASVYVDGYFTGRVDDFDGVFQRLRIEPGPHRIEIRADGYEPLSFEVRIPPDRSVTYEGELKPRP